MTLNERQQLAFETILKGKNVFLTGGAGVGKSYLLTRIICHFKSNGIPIGVSATTGIAALQIKGRTVHGLLGLGMATKSAQELYTKNRRKFPQLMKLLRAMVCIIIDEISMMSNDLFEKINEYLKLVRNSTESFGGLQIILCGDFSQLPPVSGTYCFKTLAWNQANLTMIELTEVVRQIGDTAFINILESVRWGKASSDIVDTLGSTSDKTFPYGIEPTILYSRNVDVDSVNTRKVMELVDANVNSKTYNTRYAEHELSKSWGESLRVEATLLLAVGAQVMLTNNINVEDGLVNGSRGIILQLTEECAQVKFTNGEVVTINYITMIDEMDETLWIRFMPLKLAYAISIHKSQGLTLDAVVMDLGPSIFAEGQAYTALSRAKSLESIKILAVRERAFKCNSDVLTFYGK